MLDVFFSHAERTPVAFTVLLATPDMASKQEFCRTSVLGGTMDCTIPSDVYASLHKARVYGIRFSGNRVVPLAIPVEREKLIPLYHLILNCGEDCTKIISWFSGEPMTVEDMMAAVRTNVLAA